MTRLVSCNAPSKSLRSYRRRARPSGSVCANAECAQEKNKTTTKIQVHLFILIIPSKISRRPKARRRDELLVLDFVERLSRHHIIDGAIRFYPVIESWLFGSRGCFVVTARNSDSAQAISRLPSHPFPCAASNPQPDLVRSCRGRNISRWDARNTNR